MQLLEASGRTHAASRQFWVNAAAGAAADAWGNVDPAAIVPTWTEQVPSVLAVASGAQLAAAKEADGYLDDVTAAEGLDPVAVSPIAAEGFAGVASDGRPLLSLLMSPAFQVLTMIGSGLPVAEAMPMGGHKLDAIVRTQVADAGRVADQVALASRYSLDGYVRVVIGSTCSRCLILAGKFYRWNRGFARHPRCDCAHLPTVEARVKGLLADPRALYDRLTPEQRTAAGWSQADQLALQHGADIYQVTNAQRGVYTAGGREFTTEGSTRGGLARARLGRGNRRITPDQIFIEAGDDRDEAMRLLYRHGYLMEAPAAAVTRSTLTLAAAEASPEAAAAGGTARAAASVVHIRPQLQAARSARQVGEAFMAEAQRITGRRISTDFAGSVATAREHAEGVLRGLERFPDVQLRSISNLATAGREGSYASAIGDRLYFHPKWTDASARNRYLDNLRRDVDAHWHPAGMDNPAGIAIHEFGHLLDIGTLGERAGEQIERIVADAAAAAGMTEAELIRFDISRYAATDAHELAAEAFADVLLNGQAASQLSLDIYEALRAEYVTGGRVFVPTGRAVLAAADPLAGLKVAELKAMAKERGIVGYSKLTKPQLLERLRSAQAPAAPAVTDVAAGRAATRAAARERNRLLEARTKVADLLAELDELLVKKADSALFRQAFDSASGVDPAVIEGLRKVAGEPAKLRAAMTRTGTKFELKPVSGAGKTVVYDPAVHDPVGAVPAEGTRMVVIRRGASVAVDGRMIVLNKATVKAVPAKAPTKRAAPPKATTESGSTAAYVRRRAELARATASEVVETRQLGGGYSAYTNLVTTRDGRFVEKIYGERMRDAAPEVIRAADAEELGAALLDALGVETAAVERLGRGRLGMEYLDAPTAAERGITELGAGIPKDIVDSDDARMIGLADVLMGNSDRNTGNWLIRRDGRLAGIDHGAAFQPGAAAVREFDGGYNPFSTYLTTAGADDSVDITWAAANDLTRADLAIVRARMEALRPRFVEAKRTNWYNQVMARLGQIERRAVGTRNRIAP